MYNGQQTRSEQSFNQRSNLYTQRETPTLTQNKTNPT
jgi:hypothetical protein